MTDSSSSSKNDKQAPAEPQADMSTAPSSLPADFPHIPIGHPDTMMSVESVRRAVQDFKVRPSDVIVATFAKTGTTLVCWLCHLIRTGGNVDFDAMETLYEVGE